MVHQQVNGRVSAAFADLGEQDLKNIARPVRAYRIALDEVRPETAAPASAAPAALALPDKPSIAVLPFKHERRSGAGGLRRRHGRGHHHGVVADSWLFVIARNSSFIYKGRASMCSRSARDLGVRYVLEGSVRKSGNRVRITGQLIDAATRAHLWADKFDGSLEDIFALQDGVTESVVGALVPSLHKAELERARRKPPADLRAYDFLLRAAPSQMANTPEAAGEAIASRRGPSARPGLRLCPCRTRYRLRPDLSAGRLDRSAPTRKERRKCMHVALSHSAATMALSWLWLDGPY